MISGQDPAKSQQEALRVLAAADGLASANFVMGDHTSVPVGVRRHADRLARGRHCRLERLVDVRCGDRAREHRPGGCMGVPVPGNLHLRPRPGYSRLGT